MKSAKYVAILSTLALLTSLSALAADKLQRTVQIPTAVQVGTTQLEPGSYKVEWQGAGPAVQVSFLQHGKTVATVPGTLKSNDNQVTEDAITTDPGSANSRTLREIDFGHQKEALLFAASGM